MNIKEYTGWTKSGILKKGCVDGFRKEGNRRHFVLGGGEGDTRIYFPGILYTKLFVGMIRLCLDGNSEHCVQV